MTGRSTPYPPPSFRVRIPKDVWMAALEDLRRYASRGIRDGRRGSEGLVYFAGVATPNELIVTSLLRLHHAPQGDRVEPTPEEVRWLLWTLRERDEKLIAQFHTHRYGADHSVGDDQMATSFHDGFLSIVAPRFAIGIERLDQCIVHEYRNGVFQPLSAGETAERFTVFAQVLDRAGQVASEGGSTLWKRFVQRLRSIARR